MKGQHRLILFIAIVLAFPISATARKVTSLPVYKPNVVVFMIDDMGWADCSVAFWGRTGNNYLYNTVNLQRLADRGMRFTRAYGASTCSPGRVTFLTGLCPLVHNVTGQIHELDKPGGSSSEVFMFPTWNYNGLQPDNSLSNSISATTLPQVLSADGYQTINSGQAYFAPEGSAGWDPRSLGYQYNITSVASGMGPFDIVRQEDKPFFLAINYTMAGNPVADDDPVYLDCLAKGIPAERARYVALVAGADSTMGILLDYIDNKGLKENTVVIFTSVNGGESPYKEGEPVKKYNYPLKGGKGSPYEGAIRIPMIISGPGIKDTSRTRTPVELGDLFPTIINITGIKKVKTGHKLCGMDFTPLLKGERRHRSNRSFVWHFPNSYGGGYDSQGAYSAIVKGNWKLIYYYDTESSELYDLSVDIFEVVDQSNNPSMSVTLHQLRRELTHRLKKNGSSLPYFKVRGEWCRYPDGRPFKKGEDVVFLPELR